MAKPWGRSSAEVAEPPSKGGKRRAAAETPGAAPSGGLSNGAVLKGIIKSYNRSTGYGFVNAAGHQGCSGIDMYFQTRDMSPALQERAAQRDGVQGAPVQFCLQALRDGKWRARDIEAKGASKQPAPAQAQGPAPAPSVAGATSASVSTTSSRPPAGGGARSPQGAGIHSKHEIRSRVEHLTAMGFSEEQAQKALSESELNVNRALDLLLSGNFSDALADTAGSTGGSASAEASEPAPEPPTRACAEHESAASGAAAASHGKAQRVLARMQCDWVSEDPGQNQLSACRGTLVWLWPSTKTEVGWAYAERLDRDPARAGWLPFDRCQELPDGSSYAYVVEEDLAASAGLDAALGVGEVVVTDSGSNAQEGSVHFELCDGSGAGWLPSRALAKLPESYQWKSVSRSCDAMQDSQLPIRKGASVVVQADTQTSEGWVYAWATDVCLISGRRGGWVPVDCLA